MLPSWSMVGCWTNKAARRFANGALELIRHAVCLGRSPGFRKKDVDMAFEASLITAF